MQRRFHGKAEIATTADASVEFLLTKLEELFHHGLKRRRGAPATFWPFVSQVLDPADTAALAMLKHISTDVGRGRATCSNRSRQSNGGTAAR